jgi:hypothetical protein
MMEMMRDTDCSVWATEAAIAVGLPDQRRTGFRNRLTLPSAPTESAGMPIFRKGPHVRLAAAGFHVNQRISRAPREAFPRNCRNFTQQTGSRSGGSAWESNPISALILKDLRHFRILPMLGFLSCCRGELPDCPQRRTRLTPSKPKIVRRD